MRRRQIQRGRIANFGKEPRINFVAHQLVACSDVTMRIHELVVGNDTREAIGTTRRSNVGVFRCGTGRAFPSIGMGKSVDRAIQTGRIIGTSRVASGSTRGAFLVSPGGAEHGNVVNEGGIEYVLFRVVFIVNPANDVNA